MKTIKIKHIRQTIACFILACLTGASNLAAVNSGAQRYLAAHSSSHFHLFDVLLPRLLLISPKK